MLAQRPGQVADVVLDPAGDVPLVGADQADAHVRPAGGRRAGGSERPRVRPARSGRACASPRAAGRSPSAKASATDCIAPATRSLSRPGPSTGISGENTSRQPRSVNWQTVGISAEPVWDASTAPPPGIVAVRPKKSTGTPPLPRFRSTSRQRDAGLAQPVAEHLGAGSRPAGQRDDPETQGLPVVEEPPVERLRLQPLGDGHERAAEEVDEPDAGGVPVPAVRQHHHQATARCRAPSARAPGRRPRCRRRSARCSASAAGRPPASTARRTAARGW